MSSPDGGRAVIAEIEGDPLFSSASTISLLLNDVTAAGEARRQAVALAELLGMGAELAGRVALVATELATNAIRHGGGGEIFLRALPRNGVELLVLDRGPGMPDLHQCLQDGFSTAGSAGYGLGMIARQATEWDVFTAPGKGTVVVARFWEAPPERGRFTWGVVCRPHPGEEVCGDGWAAVERNGELQVAVADGLGHGPLAADAARAALESFGRHASKALVGQAMVDVLDHAHAGLRSLRGAAMTLATLEPKRRLAHVLGVGNVTGSILTPEGASRGVVSQNGTLGAVMRRSHPFSYPWPDGGLIVLHSDGLASHWRFDPYPGLRQRDPAVIAGVLYRDFKRGTDDVTVFVARERTQQDRVWTSVS